MCPLPRRPKKKIEINPKRKILVVDDSRHIIDGVNATRHHVENRGHTVQTATSFLEAVRQIRTHKPDIVLTDFQLGRSDQTGLHVAREAKKANPKVRVRIHSMGANELRKAKETLRSFGLEPRDVYEKHKLARLLSLPQKEHVYFDPKFIDFIEGHKQFFPGGVIRFGVNSTLETIISRHPKELVYVGGNTDIFKVLNKSLSILGINLLRVETAKDAISSAKKGQTLLITESPKGNAIISGAEHNARNILSHLK